MFKNNNNKARKRDHVGKHDMPFALKKHVVITIIVIMFVVVGVVVALYTLLRWNQK